MSNTKTQNLWCEKGQHRWDRPSARGVKPRNCPEHQAQAQNQSAQETLTCQAGHTWQRPPARGRKPIWCPEHTPKPESREAKPASVQRYLVDLDKLRERVGERIKGPVQEAFRALDFLNGRLRNCAAQDLAYYRETQRIWLRRIELDTNVSYDPAIEEELEAA